MTFAACIFSFLIGFFVCMAIEVWTSGSLKLAGWLKNRRRFEAAKAALTGLLADPTKCPELRKGPETCTQATVRLAVEHGDELIRRLGA